MAGILSNDANPWETNPYIPEEANRNNILGKWILEKVQGLLSLPQRAFESSENLRQAVQYDPGPILEAATLPMGTGAIAGLPLRSGEAALGAGILRPKAVGAYHGTSAPTEFSTFRSPPVTHDIGVHSTIDPDVTAGYINPFDPKVHVEKDKWMDRQANQEECSGGR